VASSANAESSSGLFSVTLEFDCTDGPEVLAELVGLGETEGAEGSDMVVKCVVRATILN
jgi:hypothetical protein